MSRAKGELSLGIETYRGMCYSWIITLGDPDVSRFYQGLLKDAEAHSEAARKIMEVIGMQR